MKPIATLIFALSLLACVLAWPADAAAQGGQYYSSCPSCAKYVGGNGIIGPFSTEAECIVQRDLEVAQHFPFGPCTTTKPTITEHHSRAKVSVPLLGALGAAAGGAGGFALSHGESTVVSQD